MENKLKEMCDVPDKILETLQKDIAEIKVALLGNEYNPTAGLLYRMTEAEKELSKLKMRYERLVWTASGVAVTLSVIFNLIMAFFDKFFFHTV